MRHEMSIKNKRTQCQAHPCLGSPTSIWLLRSASNQHYWILYAVVRPPYVLKGTLDIPAPSLSEAASSSSPWILRWSRGADIREWFMAVQRSRGFWTLRITSIFGTRALITITSSLWTTSYAHIPSAQANELQLYFTRVAWIISEITTPPGWYNTWTSEEVINSFTNR